jgi:hypothetical protein
VHHIAADILVTQVLAQIDLKFGLARLAVHSFLHVESINRKLAKNNTAKSLY